MFPYPSVAENAKHVAVNFRTQDRAKTGRGEGAFGGLEDIRGVVRFSRPGELTVIYVLSISPSVP